MYIYKFIYAHMSRPERACLAPSGIVATPREGPARVFVQSENAPRAHFSHRERPEVAPKSPRARIFRPEKAPESPTNREKLKNIKNKTETNEENKHENNEQQTNKINRKHQTK